MKVSFESVGGFENTIKWLTKASTSSPLSAMNALGQQGVDSLRARTPVATGETARSWSYKVEKKAGYTELSWSNNAHMGATASIARIIDSGHGTGWGGYVPPKPYIREAMSPVFDNAGDKLMKELTD